MIEEIIKTYKHRITGKEIKVVIPFDEDYEASDYIKAIRHLGGGSVERVSSNDTASLFTLPA